MTNAAFQTVDLATAELELTSSIYEGFSTAIMLKGQPRTVALCREYADAIQIMAAVETCRTGRAFEDDVEREWQRILDKDDRNSPEDYPDMVLITREELAQAMRREQPRG